ncbi:tetratricopeptide repeat protein [Acetivibrio ethanolgignens]|uniref:Uncharacterized protein n=1 Tax=Acetivibrio ethanolgignens TaxID=290052 RepID=A0A0V8QD75_9FIRM|nr:tetratricopeptide repeat protein [Acetivibrio ethanolgignens]KSV58484.1 hypothetical protein ASU35_12740 [Acetivibrio ethanolgignens]
MGYEKKSRFFLLLFLIVLLLCSCGEEKRADSYLKEGNYAEAISLYEELVSEKDSDRAREKNERLYSRMGVAYCGMEDYEAAIDCFEKAAGFSEEGRLSKEELPTQIFAYNEQGLSYLKASEYEKALEVILKGISLEPEEEQKKTLVKNKIIVLEHLSRFEEAFAECEGYIGNYPEDEEMLKEYEFLKTRIKEEK